MDAAGNAATADSTGSLLVYITEEELQPLMTLGLNAETVKDSTLLESSSSAYTFTVTYLPKKYDIKRGTISDGDIKVINNLGYKAFARLVSRTAGSVPGSIVATYKITPPGGSWNSSDNTVYTVALLNRQVRDTGGHDVPGGKLGKFKVNVLPSGGVVITPQDINFFNSLASAGWYISPTDELFNSQTRILDGV
jgi:hypothetical protein